MKEETDRTGFILKAGLPSWARLWTLSYMPSIYGNDIPTGKPGPLDGACSLCFLLHSPLLMLLTHSMSIIHRDILHPDSLTSNLGERHQPLGYEVHNTL